MKRVIETGLPQLGLPLEWATMAGDQLYTTVVPIRADGSIETEDVAAQMDLTFANLKQVLTAAGGSMTDITLVQVFLTDIAHTPQLNEAWSKYFEAPYPNRATMIISGMVAPGIVVECTAYAHISQ